MWKLFSSKKQDKLVDILKGYSEEEVRKAIPKAFKGCHFSGNPGRRSATKIVSTSAETGGGR